LIYSEGEKGLVEGAVGVFRTYGGLKLFVGVCDSFFKVFGEWNPLNTFTLFRLLILACVQKRTISDLISKKKLFKSIVLLSI
jgi:hypothetical protein